MLQAMRSKRYEKYGYRSEALHLGEDGVVSTLDGTACGRLNLIFRNTRHEQTVWHSSGQAKV